METSYSIELFFSLSSFSLTLLIYLFTTLALEIVTFLFEFTAKKWGRKNQNRQTSIGGIKKGILKPTVMTGALFILCNTC